MNITFCQNLLDVVERCVSCIDSIASKDREFAVTSQYTIDVMNDCLRVCREELEKAKAAEENK